MINTYVQKYVKLGGIITFLIAVMLKKPGFHILFILPVNLTSKRFLKFNHLLIRDSNKNISLMQLTCTVNLEYCLLFLHSFWW